MQDLENAVRELLNMVADQAVIDELAKANAEIARLQDELRAQKSYTQSLGEDRLRAANERDALRAEVERMRREITTMHVLNDVLREHKDAAIKSLEEFRAAWAKLKGMLK